jgi:predicted HAD superfamily Cof-like phosphohydrolase
MTKLRAQVTEFHQAFGVPAPNKPQAPGLDRVQLRLRLIGEEFCELVNALGCDPQTLKELETAVDWSIRHLGSVDLVDAADALADLDYVIEGTRLEFGIDGEPIADEVHRSNMAKLGQKPRPDGKITKPEGWQPPDVAGCLKAQGWDGK